MWDNKTHVNKNKQHVSYEKTENLHRENRNVEEKKTQHPWRHTACWELEENQKAKYWVQRSIMSR